MTLQQVVARFNAVCPIFSHKRTVQRWMARKGLRAFGSSQKLRFYDGAAVEKALDEDFNYHPAPQKRRAA